MRTAFSNNEILRTESKSSVVDKICAFLLVMSPILQHYQGLLRNAGFTILILLCPFLAIKVMNILKKNIRISVAIIPLILYEFYTAFHIDAFSVMSLAYAAYIIILFLCVATKGCIDGKLCIKYSLVVAKIASILVIAQTVSYYLLDYYIRCIPVDWLLPDSDMWLNRVVNGVTSAGALFRPSSIFLEPSHLVLYTFPHVCICLLSSNKDIKSAVIVSLGIGLSTSGMGIGCLLLLWGVYFIFYSNKNKDLHLLQKIFSVKTMVVVLSLLIMFCCLYLFVPVFKETVDRIFVGSIGHSSAIDGRTRLANILIKELKGKELLFGVAEIDDRVITFNMAGFHATLYKWGIVGVALSYWFYVRGLFKLKNAYFWITIVILILSFFTVHTHGTFYMIYFIIFLLDGYFEKKSVRDGKSKVDSE